MLRCDARAAPALLRKLGSTAQLGGISRFSFAGGRAAGVRAAELRNAAGLQALVLEDLCLDVYRFSYRGVELGFLAKNGLCAPAHYNGQADAFAGYFRGGMLYTCGLGNTGPPCVDDGAYHPEHGGIAMAPTEHISCREDWQAAAPALTVSGAMRESTLCGGHLRLERSITMPMFESELRICDVVRNMEGAPAPHMMLYHLNVGYPLLDEGTRLYTGAREVRGRGGETAQAIAECRVMTAPRDDKHEDVFFHEAPADESGNSYALAVNRRLGLGFYVRYSGRTLPVLTQWKNMCAHDYVLGIEPGNCPPVGRRALRENGALPHLPPYGEVRYDLVMGVLEGNSAIDGFIAEHFPGEARAESYDTTSGGHV